MEWHSRPPAATAAAAAAAARQAQRQGAAKEPPGAAAAAAPQQQPQVTDGSSSSSRSSSGNPWELSGADAPANWQQLDTSGTCSSGRVCSDMMLQSNGSMPARQDNRPDSPLDKMPGTVKAASSTGNAGMPATPACSTPDGARRQQQQQQHQDAGCSRAARQLFQQLPLSGNASMNRQGLQLLALGLQWALQQAGAPVQLQLPQYERHNAAADSLDSWSVFEQQQLLGSALSACDSLHSAMQQAAAAAQQQSDTMAALEQQLECAQQHNEQLTGRFHIIAEQVQQAKVVLQQRMLEERESQLQAARLQWQQQEAAARSSWQQQLMQEVQQALGRETADSLRTRMLPLLQRSSDGQCEDDGDKVHQPQLQVEEEHLPAAAAGVENGCQADDCMSRSAA
ncbi:hypothetical protein COO60DRAFT_1698312 [Scenedesmus sp. NREL 46B-D3]|nr:hypothetical protein COO60DRAFT_1698312 [Scenedesmus sp. NREL 46B-D3]